MRDALHRVIEHNGQMIRCAHLPTRKNNVADVSDEVIEIDTVFFVVPTSGFLERQTLQCALREG